MISNARMNLFVCDEVPVRAELFRTNFTEITITKNMKVKSVEGYQELTNHWKGLSPVCKHIIVITWPGNLSSVTYVRPNVNYEIVLLGESVWTVIALEGLFTCL